jgi:hypothetical protein
MFVIEHGYRLFRLGWKHSRWLVLGRRHGSGWRKVEWRKPGKWR